MLCGCVVWARCPYLLLLTFLLFYFFTFFLLNALWVRGMGKMPIPPTPTFYFFTLLLFYFSIYEQ